MTEKEDRCVEMGGLKSDGPPKDADLFQFLNSMLQQPTDLKTRQTTQVEESSGGPEVELRSKIEALRTETQKVPAASTSGSINEAEVSNRLENLSARLAKVQAMIADVETDPDAKSFLQDSAALWMPLITANADQRRAASSTPPDPESKPTSK